MRLHLDDQDDQRSQVIEQVEDVNWSGKGPVFKHDQFFENMGHGLEWRQQHENYQRYQDGIWNFLDYADHKKASTSADGITSTWLVGRTADENGTVPRGMSTLRDKGVTHGTMAPGGRVDDPSHGVFAGGRFVFSGPDNKPFDRRRF
jgi:hypothetical protein